MFAYPARPHLVYEVIKAYQAGLRRGTHATKTRALVSGGGKKPWQQKGTGRARVTARRRSPLWRHGGTTFGPQPRSYAMKVNIKAKKNALQVGALGARQGRPVHVSRVASRSSHHRTKDLQARLGKRRARPAEKVLFVDSYENLNLHAGDAQPPRAGRPPTRFICTSTTSSARAAGWCSRGGRCDQLVEVSVVMKDARQIIMRPIVTEKTADAKEHTNTVCFEVARDANRIEIRKAVETLFGVKVVDVRVAQHARQAASLRSLSRARRPDWRKAYVRLAAGEKTVDFFDQV